MYASDPDRHVVWRYTYDRQRTLGFGSIDVPYLTDDAHFNGPVGVAVGADGMRYVVEGAGRRLLKLGPDDAARWTVGEPGVAETPIRTAGITPAPAIDPDRSGPLPAMHARHR